MDVFLHFLVLPALIWRVPAYETEHTAVSMDDMDVLKSEPTCCRVLIGDMTKDSGVGLTASAG